MRRKNVEDFVKELKKLYLENQFYFKQTYFIVFVCGGDVKSKNFRSSFLAWAKQQKLPFFFVLAEDAFKVISGKKKFQFINMAKFEKFIATISHCILVFPESPGSFAEVGYFSSSQKIVRKMLVANHIQYQGESFLNLGPLDHIAKKSHFSDKVILSSDSDHKGYATICDKLLRLDTYNKNAKTIYGAVSFSEQTEIIQISLLLKLVQLFRNMAEHDLHHIVANIFGKYKFENVEAMLGILQSMKCISVLQIGTTSYIQAKDGIDSGINIQGFNEQLFRLQITENLISSKKEGLFL